MVESSRLCRQRGVAVADSRLWVESVEQDIRRCSQRLSTIGAKGEWRVEAELFKLLPSDEARVIGTDHFLASLPPPRVKPASRLTIEQLAIEVCARHKVSVDEVRAENRQRRLTKARTLIARRAVDERFASRRQVARFMNRSVSAICQLLQRVDLG